MRRISGLFFVFVFASACQLQKLPAGKNLRLVKPFENQGKPAVFRTRFTFFSNEFSGNLVIKKQTDNSHRLVFLNEIGMKFFDFTLSQDSFAVSHIFSPMNRKSLLSLLENDFRYILLQFPKEGIFFQDKKQQLLWRPKEAEIHYAVNKVSGFPESAFAPSFFRRKTTIRFLNYTESLPQKIVLRHRLPLKVRIEMELLKKNPHK